LAESAAPAVDIQRSRSLVSIQVLRAVAALGVLVHHVANEITGKFGLSFPFKNIIVGAGGVDLFFVISGFVMVYASESLFARPGAPRIFLLRRLARVAPLYWSVTAILVGYLFVAHRIFPPPSFSTEGVIATFAFLPYPRLDGWIAPVHVLGWTLNYEMFFYVVFAAAILLPRRRAVSAIVALFLALVAIGRLFALPQPFAFWFDPLILEFCFGMLIAHAYREGIKVSRAAQFWMIAAAMAGYAGSAVFGPAVDWRVLEWGLPGAALVAGLALGRDAFAARPVTRAFAFLGDASYSLYLVHFLVFVIVYRVLKPWFDLPPMPWIYGVALLSASIAAALLSYVLFERPITRFLQARIGKPAA
jgi:exopolysaccharide production protein ExoZ